MNGDKDMNFEQESSHVQTTDKYNGNGEAAYFCCGDKTCHLWKCPTKDKIPIEDWHRPEHVPKENAQTKVESPKV